LRQGAKSPWSIAFFTFSAHFKGDLTDAPIDVLITGATGFVGSHLVEALSALNTRIRALVRPSSNTSGLKARGVEVVVGSFDDSKSLLKAAEGQHVVVHLAALTRARSEAEYREVNGAGTRALLSAVAASGERGRRFVYLSSLAAVGPAINGRPVERIDTPHPLTAYGRSKLEGEVAAQDAAYGVRPIILRAPAVYGPRERDLYSYFRMASLGILPAPTGPDRPVQLIHVHDLAAALVKAIEAPSASGVYHVAENRGYAWSEVAQLIAKAVGRRAWEVRIPAALVEAAAAASEWGAAMIGSSTIFNRDKARELLAEGWLCETEAARKELGFQALIPLPEGLALTAEWYRNNGWL
jgi:nucleoside-diphosphate-sugar epimerase